MSKKLKIVLTMLAIASIYFVAVDPNVSLLQNLPFGEHLVMMVYVAMVSIIFIGLVEWIPDLFVDGDTGKEDSLVKKAVTSAEGASNIYLGRSIRVVGYCIIIAAAVNTIL